MAISGIIGSELDRLVTRANAAHQGGDATRAEVLLRQVLFWDPGHLFAHDLMAALAIERHDHETARRHVEAVLAREPYFAPSLAHLAQALWLAGRLAEAPPPARLAVSIQPGNAEYRLILGQVLAWLEQTQEAQATVRPILEQTWHPAPIRARAHGVIAEALTAAGEFGAATQAFERAVALSPEQDALWMGHALGLLRLGRFKEGWAAYARRSGIGFFFQGGTGLPGTPWRGQDLRDRTILLKDEQGYGDAIQFFRYLPALRAAGARRIVLLTFPMLVNLFRASTDAAEITVTAPADLQPDYHCLTADLPGGFGTTLETIPAPKAYLTPQAWAAFVPPPGRGKLIGLCWSGDPRHLKDHLRSIPASLFLRLTDGVPARFVAVQNTVRPADEDALRARPRISRLGETMGDFAATAGMVAKLDLVITVDTSVAHLAGALGKPVWLLLPRAPDWRWLVDRADTPWYPAARLFRADARGWDPVIDAVRAALRDWIDRDFRRVLPRPGRWSG